MAVKLVGHIMPEDMSKRASNYLFEPAEIIGRNGDGNDIESAAGASLLWEWTNMSLDEWSFLYNTVLGGAASVYSNQAGNTVIRDNMNQFLTFDEAVVHRPHYKILSGGNYQHVTLIIDQLR